MFPLCLGRVMSHRLALIFVWGIIFVDDLSYVPPDLTFFYGVISVAFVVGPLLLILVRTGFPSQSLALPFSKTGVQKTSVAVDRFFGPKKDLLTVKIIEYCDCLSVIVTLLPIPTSVTVTEVLCIL